MINFIYTGIITFVIMLLLHHLYNYLQSNLTIPKVNQINTAIVNDLNEITQDLKHKELEKEFKKMQKENKNIQIQKLTNKLQINGGIHILRDMNYPEEILNSVKNFQ